MRFWRRLCITIYTELVHQLEKLEDTTKKTYVIIPPVYDLLLKIVNLYDA